MKPNQRKKNAGEKGKENLVKADRQEKDLKGPKRKRKRHDTILKMGNIREIRSLIVGQMKSPRCGRR